MKLAAVGRPYTVMLEHAVVCASTGKCACSLKEKQVVSWDREGNVLVKYKSIRLPQAITLMPGVTTEVPDSLIRSPRLARAIHKGRVCRR